MIGKLSALSLAIAAALAMAAPASAGVIEPGGERVFADSYGNLIIHSRAGYKRIVVGAGHRVPPQAAEAGPRIVYLDEQPYRVRHVYRCFREPAIVYGRSYMYGLPEGAVPVIAGPCR